MWAVKMKTEEITVLQVKTVTELQTFIFATLAVCRRRGSLCPLHTSRFSLPFPAPFSPGVCKICELIYTIFNKIIVFHILKKP